MSGSNEIQLRGLNPKSPEAISLMMQEDLASLPRIMLRRVKNPSGGATNFTLKDENGQDKFLNVISGVVVHHGPMNAMWTKGQEEDSLQCQSPDGITGFGNPGGSCAKCQMNKFSNDGTPKLCKNSHTLYLLPIGEAMPMIVTIPPTSLNAWAKFLSEVLGPHQKPTKTVEIAIKLTAHKEAGKSMSWALFSFEKVRDLEDAEIMNAINKAQVVKVMQAQNRIELSANVSQETDTMLEVADEIVQSMKKDPIGIKADQVVKSPKDARRTLMQMVLKGTNMTTGAKEREIILEKITGKKHTTEMTPDEVEVFLEYVQAIQGGELDLSPKGLEPVSANFFELFVGAVEFTVEG